MEYDLYIKVFLSFIFVVLLIISTTLIIRYIQTSRFKRMNREVSLQEVLFIDNKNKIALIKRKKSKYIVLLSENNNLVLDVINES